MKGRHLSWILAPLLVAALVLEAGRAARHLQANRVVAAVKRVTVEANQRGRLSKPLLERNVRLLREAERLAPADVTIPIARGGQYMMMDRYVAAIQTFEKALEIEPRGEVYAHIGKAQLKLGRRAEADVAFFRAIRLDHNQRRHLVGYFRPLKSRARRAAQHAEAGAIFVDDFESGDLSGWSGSQSRGGEADE